MNVNREESKRWEPERKWVRFSPRRKKEKASWKEIVLGDRIKTIDRRRIIGGGRVVGGVKVGKRSLILLKRQRER